jgi:hypothetical protein
LRIALGKSRKEIGICDTEMTFDQIIRPGQSKNLHRPQTVGAVSVTIKPPVEKNIAGLDLRAPSKAGFHKGTCQDDARITVQVQVARGCAAQRKYLESCLK